MELVLKKHQQDALWWAEGKSKYLLALDMGLGKTLTSLMTIKPGERVLVICPATLKINWQL